jgi:hypothetical protein
MALLSVASKDAWSANTIWWGVAILDNVTDMKEKKKAGNDLHNLPWKLLETCSVFHDSVFQISYTGIKSWFIITSIDIILNVSQGILSCIC